MRPERVSCVTLLALAAPCEMLLAGQDCEVLKLAYIHRHVSLHRLLAMQSTAFEREANRCGQSHDRRCRYSTYEWHDDSGHWFRSYGNENWEFDENGLMRRRIASINDLPIKASERLYHWPLGRRPDNHPGLSDLAL